MATVEKFETLDKKIARHKHDCKVRIAEIGDELDSENRRHQERIASLNEERGELETELFHVKRIYYADVFPASSNADMDFLPPEEREQADRKFLSALGLFAEPNGRP